MLAPRARKRTRIPRCNSPRARSLKSFESDPLLVIEVEDRVDRTGVRLERIAVTRNCLRHFLQKCKCRVHVFVPMKRHKTARKQFRHCLAVRKPSQYISASVFQNEYSRQGRTSRRCKRCLSVPGSPVHNYFPPAFANNDPVVTQDLNIVLCRPQPRCCALSSAGVPNKQVA